MTKKPIKESSKEDVQGTVTPLFKSFHTRFIALTIYFLIAGIGIWIGFLLYKWLINKLFSWSPTTALIITVISLIWCIVTIFFYQIFTKIFLWEEKNNSNSRLDDLVVYLFLFGRDLSAFFFYFISFAYLCWEIQSIWGQQFSGNVFSVNSLITYAFENAIDIVESDILSIYKIKLSNIEPISYLSKNLVFFFRLFIKLVIIGFAIRFIRYLFHLE